MQNTKHILMIRPVNFGYNAQTAVNNSFQKNVTGNLQKMALQEFNGFVELLKKNKVDVTVIEDTITPSTPDSIFPNNWVSFNNNGSVFLYPMFAINRRQERKTHVLDAIRKEFDISEIIDLSYYESEQRFLEGTGSMVLDRQNKIAYACLSARTDEKILENFCKKAGYNPVTFNATDLAGTPIYHTNVLMCVADRYAVVCLAAISNEAERTGLAKSLQNTGKIIIDISIQQLNSFAGNMLQVKNEDDELLLVMSSQAYGSLTAQQVTLLQKYNRIIHASLKTIETAGGGSARCMMAEVFLQKK